eukprot:3351870-Pleurochrysis_carterae.AAC.2
MGVAPHKKVDTVEKSAPARRTTFKRPQTAGPRSLTCSRQSDKQTTSFARLVALFWNSALQAPTRWFLQAVARQSD